MRKPSPRFIDSTTPGVQVDRRAYPAMWYDANGYEWGVLGPHGEQLDRHGMPLPPPRRNLLLPLALLALVVLTLVAVGITVSESNGGANRSPGGFPTPQTYGYPPTCYSR